jgi:hypothetical protein
MTTGLIPSSAKICSKERLTVLVPDPEEPVTAIMGCFWDMGFHSLKWIRRWVGEMGKLYQQMGNLQGLLS